MKNRLEGKKTSSNPIDKLERYNAPYQKTAPNNWLKICREDVKQFSLTMDIGQCVE